MKFTVTVIITGTATPFISVGTVLPLFDRLDGGIVEQRSPAEHPRAPNVAVWIDRGFENDDALDVGGLGVGRVDRLDVTNFRRRLHIPADPNWHLAVDELRRRWRRRGGGAQAGSMRPDSPGPLVVKFTVTVMMTGTATPFKSSAELPLLDRVEGGLVEHRDWPRSTRAALTMPAVSIVASMMTTPCTAPSSASAG